MGGGGLGDGGGEGDLGGGGLGGGGLRGGGLGDGGLGGGGLCVKKDNLVHFMYGLGGKSPSTQHKKPAGSRSHSPTFGWSVNVDGCCGSDDNIHNKMAATQMLTVMMIEPSKNGLIGTQTHINTQVQTHARRHTQTHARRHT